MGKSAVSQFPRSAAFTPWYLPQGVNGNKSFPSGHTTAASITLCLFALPLFTKKRLSSWQTMLAVLSPIMMALSRMIMGAHYLSDTVFAILIIYTMLEGAILYMKKSKETG
ncbi:MAG: phosphatase PAP2 family protein [Erysipelotrichaceae bacterium]|nr:phosphatase PAP2 family protein [Erysipelotrichaceae bacterium]